MGCCCCIITEYPVNINTYNSESTLSYFINTVNLFLAQIPCFSVHEETQGCKESM